MQIGSRPFCKFWCQALLSILFGYRDIKRLLKFYCGQKCQILGRRGHPQKIVQSKKFFVIFQLWPKSDLMRPQAFLISKMVKFWNILIFSSVCIIRHVNLYQMVVCGVWYLLLFIFLNTWYLTLIYFLVSV